MTDDGKNGLRPFGLFVLLAALGGFVAGCRERAPYPNRPITIICPWSVGGGTDRVSRQMAFFLEHELGVPVNVVNATGGRGVTGHSAGLRARPDGYTIAMMTVELNMLHWQDLTTISWQDAEPLMSINEDAAAVFVRAEASWQDMNALLEEISRHPGELTASGTAAGGIWHLALAGWLQSEGLPPDAVKWVPMGGAGPSLQELVSGGGGGLDLVCCSLPEANVLYESGNVRPLGVMAEERVPGFPNVPTLKEQGMDWTTVGWRGLGSPKGTPPERVERLVTAIRRIVTGETEVGGKTFPEFMAAEGFNNRWREPDDFRRFLEQNDEKFGKLLTDPAFSEISSEGIVSPMTFPYLLFGAMGILLGCLAVQRCLPNAPKAAEPSGQIHARSVSSGTRRSISLRPVGLQPQAVVNAALVVAAVAGYVLLADTLGFVPTAGLLLFVLLWKFGTRAWAAGLITILLVPAVYHVFAHLLRVPLPRGIFGW